MKGTATYVRTFKYVMQVNRATENVVSQYTSRGI